ncbi:hypothetical protein NRBB08_1423 [Bifidobacterium breve]|nr:hypothetical protein NRBB02_1421 [Bifidobacterium breve]AUE07729.1 hypothetical protein NRBB08_1423 [Bifidobacterium breve]AUE09603.1 hypothetical protein NRBB18_1424 [Bifidobacterium breve]AUE11480.1 hypothetical protein NRBB19_1425 [Bifidobacterium breve]AUE13355.1 hypothetical protein NRBB20_1431 [Bifidobacterium breve]
MGLLLNYFNPRSPDGERREVATPCCSISYFNPRSPDGERRYDAMYHPAQWRFQSTLPGWGATTMEFRTPLAGLISIHAPRMGSDEHALDGQAIFFRFQSTLPGWGATCSVSRCSPDTMISIHAPRMGSDFSMHSSEAGGVIFQSTLPGWGATSAGAPFRASLWISIHAPRMGSDRENGHLRPRYGQNHPFSTLIVSQIVVDVLGTVRKSQKHQRTSHYEVIKQPERQK